MQNCIVCHDIDWKCNVFTLSSLGLHLTYLFFLLNKYRNIDIADGLFKGNNIINRKQ